MPWKETTIMNQKIEFICEWRTGKYTITELCRQFSISRPTAYKLIDRFENMGYEGLRDHLTARLGIDLGQTSEDGQFTLLPIVCLGTCDHAPALMIDNDLHRDLDPEKIDDILKKYSERN